MSIKHKNVCALVLLIAATIVASQDNSTTIIPSKSDESTICSLCFCDSHEVLCAQRNLTASMLNETAWDDVSDNVSVISLSHNNITSLSWLPFLNATTTLKLDNNSLSQVAWNVFGSLVNLEELDLSSNLLTCDSFAVAASNSTPTAHSIKLITLDLSDNQLASLSFATFGEMPALLTLLLGNNRLASADALRPIMELHQLKMLDLNDNQLSTLDIAFVKALPELEQLRLGGNRFTTLPAGLNAAHSLKGLLLSGNPIGNLEGDSIFPAMLALESLWLDNMPELHHIGAGALSGLKTMRKLFLSGCPKLSEIHRDAFSQHDEQLNVTEWPFLTELWMTGNNLTDIPEGLLGKQQWQSLNYVALEGNPWRCACESTWLQNVLVPSLRTRMSGGAKCGQYSDPAVKSLSLDYVAHFVANGHCGNQYSMDVLLLVSIFLSVFCLVTGCALRLARRCKRAVDADGRGYYKQV